MKTIVITGGAGFIGSHLCGAYLAEEYKVVVLDSLITGSRKSLPNDCECIEVDIQDESKLESIFKKIKPTVVSHHAAQAKVGISNDNPAYDAKVNILGLLNVLNASARYGIEQFIFASSGGTVYGESQEIPSKESMICTPRSGYGISKLAGEGYVQLFAEQAKYIPTILRYSNVYGPRQLSNSEGGVVSIFCEQMLEKGRPTINGSGKQIRDFIFVDDVVATNITFTQNKIGGVYNVGTGIETSILDLFNKIAKKVSSSAQPLFLSNQENELNRSCLDVTKLRNIIDINKFTTLDSGLDKTIDWFNTKNKRS